MTIYAHGYITWTFQRVRPVIPSLLIRHFSQDASLRSTEKLVSTSETNVFEVQTSFSLYSLPFSFTFNFSSSFSPLLFFQISDLPFAPTPMVPVLDRHRSPKSIEPMLTEDEAKSMPTAELTASKLPIYDCHRTVVDRTQHKGQYSGKLPALFLSKTI